MPNFENFPTSENKEEEKNVTEEGESKFEDEDEFEEEKNKTENDENEVPRANKSKGSRTGWKVGVLSGLALLAGGGAKEVISAEDKFADKTIDKTEQMVKSEMENEDNSQEMSDFNFTIEKVKDLITDEQLDALVDSTGMVNTSELINKIMYYHQELKAISYHKNKPDMGIAAIKFAKMHRIPGSVHIYVLGGGELAGSSTYETDTGKLKTDLFRIGQVPQRFSKDEVKNVSLIFSSK